MSSSIFSPQQLKIITSFKAMLEPKPIITGTTWCNNNFYLSPESSSIVGKVTLHKYQEEIVDAMCDEWTELIVLEKSSRIGYNKMLNMAIAYRIVNDPSVILFYSPNDQLSKDIAKLEIEPMIRDNYLVEEKIRPANNVGGRKLIDITMIKNYLGGYLQMLGAATANSFSQRTTRMVICDEISRWIDNIDGEGDPLRLAKVRNSDFYNRKTIIGSSPTLTHKNKIGEEYKETDMRIRELPCPFCGSFQPLHFNSLKFKRDDDGEIEKSSVGFECYKCKKIIPQLYHRGMDQKGVWKKQRPHIKRKAGFKINAFYGFSPTNTWEGIAKEYLLVKDFPLKLQTFTNTILGESWDGVEDAISPHELFDKKEIYHEKYELPAGVVFITAGVDTQNDRLEMLVVGHGKNRERWIIDYHVIFGDPAEVQVWKDLEEIYDNASYSHPLYNKDHKEIQGMPISAMSIDSGGGRTSYVYAFCKPRLHKRIYAIKGASNINHKEVVKKDQITKNNSKYKITFFMLGVHTIKDYIFVGIKKKTKGSNYIHIPDLEWVDFDFCEQLVSEYKDSKTGKWVLRENVRNEVFDMLVYAESAKLIVNVDIDSLAKRQEKTVHLVLKRKKESIKTEEMEQIVIPQKKRNKRILSGDII